ncbi:MAG: FAD-dependent oxidoreductase, partial [Candidatus Hydrothermarchaeota archaeon]|nr:FAD-dependent oxidoreductase [Candidatus Hydrothermarchaeota archaeon]
MYKFIFMVHYKFNGDGMKVGVIGSGLGGLLAALSLCKRGNEVVVFEKLPYAGGRFTNIERRGYQLSTGALHMVPHGERGPLAKMLRELGASVQIKTSKPEGLFRINGKDYLFDEIPGLFSIKERLKLTTALADLKFGRGGGENFREWLEKKIKNELVLKIADSFCGWVLSVDSGRAAAREIAAITKNVNKLGGPGVPLGGCGGITQALVREFEKLGGKIFYRAEVKRIEIENNLAKTLATKENSYDFDIIISNTGPKAMIKLCGE